MHTQDDYSWAGPDTPPPVPPNARAHVRFYWKAKQNELKSAEAGRPIFEEKEYVQIFSPGDKTSVVDRPVLDKDRRNHPQLYAAFKAGQGELLVGTPLTAWPGVTRSQVEELAYFHVRTVEQLAGISDGNAQNMGPVLALRQRARDFLAAAAGAAPADALRVQLAARDNEIETLKRQLQETLEAVQELRGTVKGKR